MVNSTCQNIGQNKYCNLIEVNTEVLFKLFLNSIIYVKTKTDIKKKTAVASQFHVVQSMKF